MKGRGWGLREGRLPGTLPSVQPLTPFEVTWVWAGDVRGLHGPPSLGIVARCIHIFTNAAASSVPAPCSGQANEAGGGPALRLLPAVRQGWCSW